MSFLNQDLVLVLNALYIPVGVTTIKKALISLNSTRDGENLAAQALDLEYLTKNGIIDFSTPNIVNPLKWDDWINCCVRDFDLIIHTPRRVIRAPIVIIAKNYHKIPHKKIKLSKRAAYEFYGKKCIWTGRELSLNEASLEHMTPRSKGGLLVWENCGISDRKLNAERGNLDLKDWKYKPKYKTKEPPSIAAPATIRRAARPEWEYFLIRKNK